MRDTSIVEKTSAWLADNALNALSYLFLRFAPPLTASRCTRWASQLRRPLGGMEEARAMMQRLGSRGTCLSRAVAVAARCPGSEVVIGALDPRSAAAGASPYPLRAHAWVEVGGLPLVDDVGPWREVGRIVVRA